MEYPSTNMLKRTLKAPATQGPAVQPMAMLVFELLNGVTKVHLNHLLITGIGSYAAHTAMGAFYDEVGDLADSIAEAYQGLTESLLSYPSSVELPQMKTAEDCVNYLRGLYDQVQAVQDSCSHSEIKNELDNVKTLINSTKYKLIFLK